MLFRSIAISAAPILRSVCHDVCVCVYVCMYVCVYVCMYVCVCGYVDGCLCGAPDRNDLKHGTVVPQHCVAAY